MYRCKPYTSLFVNKIKIYTPIYIGTFEIHLSDSDGAGGTKLLFLNTDGQLDIGDQCSKS